MRRAILVLAALLCGCGGGDSADDSTASRSARLVDFNAEAPYVNSFVVREDESFLLTTNKGFWAISADGKKVDRVRGTATGEPGSAPVGRFLEIE